MDPFLIRATGRHERQPLLSNTGKPDQRSSSLFHQDSGLIFIQTLVRPGGKSTSSFTGSRDDTPLQGHLEVSRRRGRFGRFRRGLGRGGGPFRAGRPGESLLLGRHLSGRLPVQAVAGAALRQRLPVGRRAGVDLQRPAEWGAAQVGQRRMRAGQRQQLLAQAVFKGWGTDRLKQAGKASMSRSMIGFTSWSMPASRRVDE